MWVILSTALLTASLLFATYGATAGLDGRKDRKAAGRFRTICFILAVATAIPGFHIMLFVQ